MLPHPPPVRQVLIVLREVKEKDDHYAFESIKNLNLQVMGLKEFMTKFKEDRVFNKRVSQQQIKCLVKF